jgi:hypothetical protein
MLIIIDRIEVFMDFHIFAILEFDLLIGYPVEKLFKEKSSHGGLDEKFRKTHYYIKTFARRAFFIFGDGQGQLPPMKGHG